MDADTRLTPPAADPAAGGPTRQRRRGWLRVTVAVAGVAVVALVALFASQLGKDPKLVRSPLIGKPAPAFELAGVDGGVVRSADLAGRPYVINFWATWCVACRKEHPYLMAFYQRWSPQGVGMVGVVYNDSLDKVSAFRAQMKAEMGAVYPDVMDPGGRTALDYGVYGVPETFVVDANGIVVAKIIGGVGPTTLERIMARLH